MKLLLTVCGFAAVMMGTTSAPAQDGPSEKEMMAVLFHGFFNAEMQVANAHWHKLTRAERDVLMKRIHLCMADPHTGMMNMTPTPKDVMEHMTSGLDASEQRTMMNIIGNMNAAEICVGTRIVKNACMYGATHAK